MKTFLHVGPGSKTKNQTTKEFAAEHWKELRIDIDSKVDADYHGTILDMEQVADEQVHGLYSSHNLEHVYSHQVKQALKEFLRVLKPEGFVVLTCPNLTPVCEAILKTGLEVPLYESPAGPITPLEILYGHTASIMQGNEYMAHKCGFTEKTLAGHFISSGFANTATISREAPFYDLWIVASKQPKTNEELTSLAKLHFPTHGQ